MREGGFEVCWREADMVERTRAWRSAILARASGGARSLLATAQRRDLFLEVLERVRRRYSRVVLACVVMPEHVHPLVSEPAERPLSTAMQALQLGFARRVENDSIETREHHFGFHSSLPSLPQIANERGRPGRS